MATINVCDNCGNHALPKNSLGDTYFTLTSRDAQRGTVKVSYITSDLKVGDICGSCLKEAVNSPASDRVPRKERGE